MKKYIYPKFPALYTTPVFRISGNGLANCLFVYAKAIILAEKYNAKIISPTWFNIALGPYLRCQSDKRHYLGLFNHDSEVSGLHKLHLLLFKHTCTNEEDLNNNGGILEISGIYDFFEPLLGYSINVKTYLLKHLKRGLLNSLNNFDFRECVAVHIRLGDFPESRRIPIQWYVSMINKYGKGKRILIFSDGRDQELIKILELPNTQRVHFGGAIQDIFAISNCQFLIGSDSSFSAWGAYLGQVPCCFYRLQFGNLLDDPSKQTIENE